MKYKIRVSKKGHTNVAMKLLGLLGFHYRLKRSKIKFEELVRMSVNESEGCEE